MPSRAEPVFNLRQCARCARSSAQGVFLPQQNLVGGLPHAVGLSLCSHSPGRLQLERLQQRPGLLWVKLSHLLPLSFGSRWEALQKLFLYFFYISTRKPVSGMDCAPVR